MMVKLMRKRKRNWLDHWLKRNCLLKDELEDGEREKSSGQKKIQMMYDIKICGSYAETKRKTENRKDWRMLGLQTHRHGTTVHDVIRLLIPALYKNQSDSLMAADGDCHHLCKLMAPVRQRWSINDVIGGIRNTVMPSDCSPVRFGIRSYSGARKTPRFITFKYQTSNSCYPEAIIIRGATARKGPRPTSRLLASRPHAEAEVDDHPTRMEYKQDKEKKKSRLHYGYGQFQAFDYEESARGTRSRLNLVELYSSGRQHSLKWVSAKECIGICTVVQKREGESSRSWCGRSVTVDEDAICSKHHVPRLIVNHARDMPPSIPRFTKAPSIRESYTPPVCCSRLVEANAASLGYVQLPQTDVI
ncbi:hypothetical protein ANN_23748 [Periplaneta americana]|uniref:Uncharacterized protein n=1 Tax=Periplaneta americana TaxID=6978 RepID=A0ABQ8SNE2_PERAM|nr:hypothetical protein ANN_23748 [Periplaneta americana]